MNSLEAIEKLRIGHEQEAQQCIEIFRSFCQWYQSQYNFEEIESTFWNACIYLIENYDLSEEKLVTFSSCQIRGRCKRKRRKHKEELILQSMLICRSNIQKIKKWHQKLWKQKI